MNCIEILRCAVAPTGSNKFGPVKGGYIEVRGQFLPVKFDLQRKQWLPLNTMRIVSDTLTEDP
jgi:hypothetical protein